MRRGIRRGPGKYAYTPGRGRQSPTQQGNRQQGQSLSVGAPDPAEAALTEHDEVWAGTTRPGRACARASPGHWELGQQGDYRCTKHRFGALMHDHKGVPRTVSVRGTPLSVEVSDATGEAPRSYRTRTTNRPFPSPHSSPTRSPDRCSSLPRASCPRSTEERGRRARRDGRSHARWDPRRPS